MKTYLLPAKVLLKDFREYALTATEQIRQATGHPVEAAGRPLEYLGGSRITKEQAARQIAE